MRAKLTSMVLILFAISISTIGCDENNNVFNDPDSSDPVLPCRAFTLNENLNIGGDDIFIVYENNMSGNVIHMYSSGSEVFVIVSNDDFAFGFSGPPTMDGLDCNLNVAMADFDKDGKFDETATSFTSTCALEGNGGLFTLFPNEAMINASNQMANAFQTFESTQMNIPCKENLVVADETFFEGLISELGYMPTN